MVLAWLPNIVAKDSGLDVDLELTDEALEELAQELVRNNPPKRPVSRRSWSSCTSRRRKPRTCSRSNGR